MTECGLKPRNEIQRLENITVYPEEYFCPKNPWTGEIKRTEKTYAMHWFKGEWNDLADKDLPFIGSIGEYVSDFLKQLESREEKSKRVIVYGLGVVGRNVLEQLQIQDTEVRVECILVTKLDNEWTDVKQAASAGVR